MNKLQNFGMNGNKNLIATPFNCFSYRAGGSAGYYSFFDGGVSDNQNFSFPNTEDNIIRIDRIFLDGFSVLQIEQNSFLEITRNDKVVCKLPLWEIISKDVDVFNAGAHFIKKDTAGKRLINPIYINGSEGIKIRIYNASLSSMTLFLSGLKYSKNEVLNLDLRRNNGLEKNDFSLYHYKTTATGSNILFAQESVESKYSKLLPLGSSESFILNAIEIVTLGLPASPNLAPNDLLNYHNSLIININNSKKLEVNDYLLYSYFFFPPSNERRVKYENYILPMPLIFPEKASVSVIFNSTVRTNCPLDSLFIFKGELIKEVS